ncbi:MAG TPA: prepilin-type N-terminal cleavage/methylation domain-containing protein [Longimicrobiales bacterium]|nr:prepilin-type N-terminal cleavage/methylation domain-containing protein [Longimicrobiales bacterium]
MAKPVANGYLLQAAVRPRRAGFTLLELLIIMIIIGILATLGLNRYGRVRERGYVATLQSELRKLTLHQELYHHEHGEYTTIEELLDFTRTPGVEIDFTYADNRGWAAIATHVALPDMQCGVFAGDEELAGEAEPATRPGMIECGEKDGDGGGGGGAAGEED